jgi:predicted RNase H-like nuclease (RuvC/YqgF family)
MKANLETTALVPITRNPAPSIIQRIINLITERGNTMKRIEIKDQLTNEQEQELFKKFYDALPKAANLKMILKGFDSYVSHQLTSGLPMENPLAKIQQLEKRLQDATPINRAKDKTIEADGQRIKELEDQLREATAEVTKLRMDFQDAVRIQENNVEAAIEAKRKADALELENLKLKGKLYDILTKE